MVYVHSSFTDTRYLIGILQFRIMLINNVRPRDKLGLCMQGIKVFIKAYYCLENIKPQIILHYPTNTMFTSNVV